MATTDPPANDPKINPPVSTIAASSSKNTPSPYEIHPNDTPGQIVTNVVLTATNYDEWAKAVRFAFTAKRKLGFLDGLYPRPTAADELEDWRAINSLLVTWVFNTIEKKLRSTFSYKESVAVVWKDIQERLQVVNGPRIQQLKGDLSNCKQHGSSIADYYGRMKKIWEDLSECDPLPSCKCGNCSCDLTTAYDCRNENEKVHQFLLGLDDNLFGTVRSNMLSVDPLPSLNKIYSTLVREENVRSMSRNSEEKSDALAFAVQGSMSRSETRLDKGDSSSRFCTYCKRHGHEAETCFQAHGLPDWWLEKQRGAGRGRGRGSVGRGRGSSTRGRGFTPARANAALVSDFAPPSSTDSVEPPGPPGISSEQWELLRNFFAAQPTNHANKMTGPSNEDADWRG